MGNRYKASPLRVAVEGLLAGMGGALVLTAMVATARKVMGNESTSGNHPVSEGISAGQALAERPNMPPNMNRVTAIFVQKIATGVFGTSLTPDQQYMAGTAWHLTYGGFWGSLYALLQHSLRIPEYWLSPLYGLGVWVIGPGWLVPKMKLMLSPNKQQPLTLAMVVGAHLAYSTIVAFILRLLGDRD